MAKQNVFVATLLASTAALSGCGGGGSSVASIPAMPTALVTSAQSPSPTTTPPTTSVFQTTQQIHVGAALSPTPALTAGTYEAFGVVATRDSAGTATISPLNSGDVSVVADPGGPTYTVKFDAGRFPGLTAAGAPAGQLAYTLGYTPTVRDSTGSVVASIDANPYGHTITVTTNFSDGTKTVETLARKDGVDYRGPLEGDADPQRSSFTSQTGQSYVSLGEWAFGAAQQQQVLFAYGERTTPGALPTSGTATYRSTDVLGTGGTTDISLTADFKGSSIAATLKNISSYSDDRTVGDYDVVQTLSGSGKISGSADFEIALSGMASISQPLAGRQFTSAVTGSMRGAFFGPDGSQIGGDFVIPLATYPLDHSQGSITGAFVATKGP